MGSEGGSGEDAGREVGERTGRGRREEIVVVLPVIGKVGQPPSRGPLSFVSMTPWADRSSARSRSKPGREDLNPSSFSFIRCKSNWRARVFIKEGG